MITILINILTEGEYDHQECLDGLRDKGITVVSHFVGDPQSDWELRGEWDDLRSWMLAAGFDERDSFVYKVWQGEFAPEEFSHYESHQFLPDAPYVLVQETGDL